MLRMPFFALLFVLGAPAMARADSPDDTLLTHSTDFARLPPARWAAEAWRVENPDPGAVVVKAESATAFVVTTAGTAMSWTLTTEPIWTAPFSTLALSYFVEGAPEAGTGPFIELFDGSTGPITPGATNTENPLASGGRYTCGDYSPGLHVMLVDLASVENLERVAEITITVRSGAEPVAVRFNQLAFLADPELPGAIAPSDFVPRGPGATPYSPLAFPEGATVGVDALERAFGLAQGAISRGEVEVSGVPFSISETAIATPLNRGGAWSLPVQAAGDTLALLCATRIWGSAEGWYSAGAPSIRKNAPHANQFRVALRYSDGATSIALPREIAGGEIGLVPGIAAYSVALDPAKTLAEVAGVEEMSYGQVALLAASVLTAEAGQSDESGHGGPGAGQRATAAASTGSGSGVEPASAPGDAVLDEFVVECENLRIALDRAGVVRSLQVGAERREIAHAPFPLITLSDSAGAAERLDFVEALRTPLRDRLVMVWNVAGLPARVELALEARKEGGLTATATLANLGADTWYPAAAMPQLHNLRAAPGGSSAYMLGARSAINDTAPIHVEEVYGGRYPLQFMDVYDELRGGGLACLVLDDTLTRKWFTFDQDESGLSRMAVSYRALALAPGARASLPPAVLLPHAGDWRGPFAQYKAWVRQRFPRTRANGLQEVFYCRRDYPLGGTTYLYDVAKPAYSFEKLISESAWAFGGVEMIDISGWAYNETIGRVGTYLENDLGGLDALAEGIGSAHAKGVQVGLYFEGYLLDKRAAAAPEGLANWQLIREGGKPAWWSGEMEFFCCPGAKGWQDKLSSDIAEVARITGADSVYVDQLGILDTNKECWAPDHGHPVPSNPIVEEIALLKRVREALDAVRPECAIYIEHLPCDAMMPWIDGAFNLGMKHTRHALGPTKLPLHRYLFPEVPVFEMVAHGIRPIPAEADDLKRSFFHGMGLWLKGRGGSWYSESFRALAPAFREVLTQYSAFFRSPDATPHVDTLMAGVYANRFPHGDQAIYTIYNANPVAVNGPVVPVEDGSTVTVLYAAEPDGLAMENGAIFARGLGPEEVAAVLVGRP